jgi:hypothetical protein
LFDAAVEQFFRHTQHIGPFMDAFLISQDIPDMSVDFFVRTFHYAVFFLRVGYGHVVANTGYRG